MNFPTDFQSIQERINQINPKKYASTRNYIDGAVTYLSPYISRGVISVNDVQKAILKKSNVDDAFKLIQELAWREYWQRLWQHYDLNILQDIKQPQPDVLHRMMVKNLAEANTGIDIIDEHIQALYETGYMHNHLRMYVASIACNVAKAHWRSPAEWLYYHLLDGDVASNHLSWQWVSASFSSKKYYCNQENINRYTNSNQTGTFLDQSYEKIATMQVPEEMQEKQNLFFKTELPNTAMPAIDSNKPVLLYNSYNLDPKWRADQDANRIFLLEPSHFKKFSVGENSIQFFIALSKNIQGIQLYCGELADIQGANPTATFIFKEHPAFAHYTGTRDERDWMFPLVKGYFPSFFSYWKKCEKLLKNL
jgi:deoxyribodipyrimidine photo-lyase